MTAAKSKKSTETKTPIAKKSNQKKGASVHTGGKRMRTIREGVENTKSYSLSDAVKMLKDRAKAKFDETIDIAVNLGIDIKQSDQNVRGIVPMPYGVGKTIRIAVFARDAKAEEAKKAGADIVGDQDLIDKIKKGEINFDRCIATPDMMQAVGSVAKILGPKGLMPNPKLGSVTTNVAEAVKSAKSGQVEFKAEKNGIVQGGVGKASFSEKAIAENIKAFINALNQIKPASVKGIYMKKVSISSTMGPAIKIDIASIAA